MASVAEVAVSLGANKSEAEGLAGQLSASKQQTEELQGEIAAVGAEGAANRASAAVQTIEGLMAEAAGLAERIGEAQDQVLAIEQAGLLTTTTGVTRDARPTAAPRSTSEPAVTSIPSGRPPRFNPEHAAKVRPFQGRAKTIGQAYTADGKALGEPIWSGLQGPGNGGPGLTEEYRRKEVATIHVEGHLAAKMRIEQIRDVVVYTNRPPCDYVPDGCRWILSDVLPEGYRMTIYCPQRGATPTVFVGNGKGVQGDE